MADSVQIYLRTDCNNSKSANLMDPSYIKQLIKMFIFFANVSQFQGAVFVVPFCVKINRMVRSL